MEGTWEKKVMEEKGEVMEEKGSQLNGEDIQMDGKSEGEKSEEKGVQKGEEEKSEGEKGEGKGEEKGEEEGEEKPMSKNQQKKLKKQQFRAQKRAEEKETMRKRKAEGLEVQKKKRRKKAGNKEKSPLAPTLVFDCSFDSLMTQREKQSMAQQLQLVYGRNRTAEFCFGLYFSSVSGVCEQQLAKNNSKTWKNITIDSKHFSELLDLSTEKVIYLSADAEETLSDIEGDTIYVIGGLVDRNRFKGASQNAAKGHGVKTAKLPLDSALLQSIGSPALTCTHMYDILQNYLKNGRKWREALLEALPSRKLKTLERSSSSSSSSSFSSSELEK